MARTDHLVRCITADGCITAMAVDSTETVQTAQMQTMSRVMTDSANICPYTGK